MSKTVFILGAGASRSVGAPLQSELIYEIFDIDIKKTQKGNDSDFMSLTYTVTSDLLSSYHIFNDDRKILAEFIVNNFGSKKFIESFRNIQDKIENEWNNIFEEIKHMEITLEDMFTILDKINYNQEHFRFYNNNYISQVRKALNRCIIYCIEYVIQTKGQKNNLYKKFAEFLVRERLNHSQVEDPFSIITLNWDNIIDKYIYISCEEKNRILRNDKKNIRILPDYCFYNHHFQEIDNEDYLPSFFVKAKGNYNIKIMKLHGSFNWLLCPQCKRMFVDYTENIALKKMANSSRGNSEKFHCRYCSPIYKITNSGYECYSYPLLNSLLITPTFIKELNNIHIKNIWHNAYLDLAEAKEVIFIGYSFPDADFEIRYLLKRSINQDTKIKVILAESDDPKKYKRDLSRIYGDISTIDRVVSKMNLPEYRYKNFFGKDNVECIYHGFEGYIEKISSLS